MGRFVLEKGIVIKGRAVDQQDQPVAGVWIDAEITGGPAKKQTELPVGDTNASIHIPRPGRIAWPSIGSTTRASS